MKKKLLIVLVVALCVAAAGYKVWYDRKQKEAFVDEWIAKGEAVITSLQTEGWTDYLVRENGLGETLLFINVLTTDPDALAQFSQLICLPADEESDADIRKVVDTLQLVWLRDELPYNISPNPLTSLPRLIFQQGEEEIHFYITMEEDRAVLSLGYKIDRRANLFLDFTADREAVWNLVTRVKTVHNKP